MTLIVRRDAETGAIVWEHKKGVVARRRAERDRARRELAIMRGGAREKKASNRRGWMRLAKEELDTWRVRRGNRDCWGWRGAASPAPLIRNIPAIEVAWLRHSGMEAVPRGFCVKRLCKGEFCTNPYHLACVSTSGKNKMLVLFDGPHEYAKLSAEQVATITRMRKEGVEPLEIANRVGILLSELAAYVFPWAERIVDIEAGA